MADAPVSSSGAVPIREASVLRYYLLAIGMSWLGWIPAGASQAGLLPFRVPIELPILTQFGPSVAALVLVGAEGGRSGVRTLLGRLVRWRFAWYWYALAALLTPAIGLLVLAARGARGDPVPDFSAFRNWYLPYAQSFQTAGPYAVDQTAQPSIGLISSLALFIARGPWHALLVFVAFAIATGPLSEELGWRGYALPNLQRRFGPLGASVLVGVLWGLWHTGPDFWSLVLQGDGRALLYPLAITGGTVPLSILITWLVRNADGSLLPVLLLHASFNSSVYLLSLTWTVGPLLPVAAEIVGVLWLGAALAAVSFGRTADVRGVRGVRVQ